MPFSDQGSAFYIENGVNDIILTVEVNSVFEKCFTAEKGGVFRFKTDGNKILSFTDTTFRKNAAI